MIFNKECKLIKCSFSVNDYKLECVKEYKYLGLFIGCKTSLLYCAYKESLNLCNINVNSWYKTVVFLSEMIGTNISLSRYKKLSLPVFKQYLKKFIRNNFLQYWSKRQQEGKSNGKLTTYFKIKDNFGIENYLFMKNFEHRKIICNLLISLELKVADMR